MGFQPLSAARSAVHGRDARAIFTLLALVLVAASVQRVDSAEPPTAAAHHQPVVPATWTPAGDVVISASDRLPGVQILRLRRDPVHLPDTRAESAPMPIRPGVWEFSGAYTSELHSPDVSFNVSVVVKTFDVVGHLLKSRRLLAISGDQSGWKQVKERFEVPSGAATASVEVAFNKTHGEFRFDGPALAYVGESIPMEGGDRKLVFTTNRVGNLFYPGDAVRIDVQLETPARLEGERLRLNWQLTDFYQAPLAAPQTIVLTSAGETAKGAKLYRGTLDLSALPLRVGPYYEVRTTIDLGASSPARDVMSFAILPEAVTTHLDPLTTPFGAHTWNATVYDYFPLAARLGIRRCLVFWDWPDQSPYTPEFDHGQRHASRLAWPKRFGLAPYGVLYPVMWTEHRDGSLYSDEALREGVRQSIEKYKGEGLWGFQIGNEPPSWNPDWVKRDVEAYKVVYEAIKATDPNIVVIGSAIGPNETFFKAGFQPYQDVYNIHAYSDLGELRNQMKKYRELFKTYGGEKPIWSTEIGSKSQGLPRDVIARDLVRKAICFFADGGGFFTWFAVGGMPDPEGERTGSYSDSMDLFAAKYNMHLPRLDAVAFYHLINTVATKTFVSEVSYEGGVHGFLFRDRSANALVVLWSDGAARDVFLPLPNVHEAALTWLNGDTRRLDARGQGVALRVGEDPVFVTFRSANVALPTELVPPTGVVVESLPGTLTQGKLATVTVLVGDGRPTALSGPSGWAIDDPTETLAPDGARLRTYRVRVPEDAVARLATFTLSDQTVAAAGDTELRFAIPVKSRIELRMTPIAGAREGDAAIRLGLQNHSDQPQTVTWKVEMVDELAMDGGTYRLTDARPTAAHFDGLASDKLTLAPRETRETVLRLAGTDRLALYRLRASATDTNSSTVQVERRVGGFARVVRAPRSLEVDGRLDDAVWRATPVYRLDELRQFCAVVKEAKPWGGVADLSGTARFAWDDHHLYIGVDVVDDAFANPSADGRMWNQDGLQFLFDPFRSAAQSRGRYDYSLGLGQKGLQAWCHMSADPSAPAGPAAGIHFAVTPTSATNGNRTYEVAIPWSRLAPFEPEPGANLGFTMVINEDDGRGRKSTIGWFGGVHLKETNFVGDLVLAEAPE